MPLSAADDFAGYVAARWPQLVRTAVLLGAPEVVAPDIALGALARCQRRWSRSRDRGDVDSLVLAELAAAWERRRVGRDRWWESGPDAGRREQTGRGTGRGPGRGPGRRPDALADRLDGLDRLRPAARAALVLDGHLDGVDPAPAPGGREPGDDHPPPRPTVRQLREAADLVPVLAPPTVAQISARRTAQARRGARRGLRAALVVGVPLLLVAGALTWLADRSPAAGPDVLGPLPVTRTADPTDVDWVAQSVLHLPHGTVPVPVLRQVAPLEDGAVYADQEGRVVALAPSGRRTVLGHEDVAVGFVSSPSMAWVAWVDPSGSTPQVVVDDVRHGRVVRRLDAPDGLRPVAVVGETVYLLARDGVHAWQPARQSTPGASEGPADLVAVAGDTRVVQVAPHRLQVSSTRGRVTVTGIGGRLSGDGTLLVTRRSGDAGGDGPIAVYDTGTGAAVRTGIADDELALDAAFGPGRTLTYLIARKADRPQAGDGLRSSFSGALQLRTCRLPVTGAAPRCRRVADIPVSGISPMLAH